MEDVTYWDVGLLVLYVCVNCMFICCVFAWLVYWFVLLNLVLIWLVFSLGFVGCLVWVYLGCLIFDVLEFRLLLYLFDFWWVLVCIEFGWFGVLVYLIVCLIWVFDFDWFDYLVVVWLLAFTGADFDYCVWEFDLGYDCDLYR